MGSGFSRAKSASASAPSKAAAPSKASAPTSKTKETATAKPSEPVAKPVAFEIKNEDSIINKHPPKRLQRLEESAHNGTKLTAEMLEQKLRIAEENRKKELDKVRRMTSASRTRRQLQDTLEDEKENKMKEFEEKKQSVIKSQTDRLKSAEGKIRETENKIRDKVSSKTEMVKDKVNRLKLDDDDFEEIEKSKYLGKVDDDWDWSDKKDTSRKEKTHLQSNHGKTKKNTLFSEDDDFFG